MLRSEEQTSRADTFLALACADPILGNGPAAHARRSNTALRMLRHFPDIGRTNLHTAVVCGDLTTVKRLLHEQPSLATQAGGPIRKRSLPAREKRWTPLLHLCYGRLPLADARENAVAIARLLLDHGADANDYFEVGSHPNRYSTLCGVAGEGEDDAPPHPQREALAKLLLERGARPYDMQLFYNTHFHSDIVWILQLIYDQSVKDGHRADWEDPEWTMIGMGGFGYGARYFLERAIERNNLGLAEWLLSHGASANASSAMQKHPSGLTLYQEASRRGHRELAQLLVRFGAAPVAPPPLLGIRRFLDACFRLDRRTATALLAQHPEFLRSPEAMLEAARRDRADVVQFLLDLGVSIEVANDSNERALHAAASHDALRTATLLVENGADLEAVERNWNNTPLDGALYGNLTRMIAYLSSVSRNIFQVTWAGNLARLRVLLDEDRTRARAVHPEDGSTLLMWLPDDEPLALAIAELLLARGTDPTVRATDGTIAADLAEQRAQYAVAARLRE